MKRPRQTLRIYARLVPRLTYGLYHISGSGGVCLSNISDAKMFATGAPDRGVIETIDESMLWHVFRRIETILSIETHSIHVKLA